MPHCPESSFVSRLWPEFQRDFRKYRRKEEPPELGCGLGDCTHCASGKIRNWAHAPNTIRPYSTVFMQERHQCCWLVAQVTSFPLYLPLSSCSLSEKCGRACAIVSTVQRSSARIALVATYFRRRRAQYLPTLAILHEHNHSQVFLFPIRFQLNLRIRRKRRPALC